MRGSQGRLHALRGLGRIPRLLLVRHGESTWNAEGRLQGQADPPLSERGREQARALAEWVGEQEVARAVSSDLARARETAELLGFPAADTDPSWREVDVGEWAGRLAMDVVAEDGVAYRAWREGREAAPGGEAYPDFAARIDGAGRALLEAAGEEETILVVCHGGAVRSLCVGLLGLELRQLGGVANGSATVIERVDSGVRLAAYNVGGAGGEVL